MKWGRVLPWALLAGVGLWLLHDLDLTARLRMRVAQRDSRIAALTRQRDSVARLASHSAARLDTLLDTLWLPARARVESLPVDVPVPYPVYRATVTAADTTITACRRALHDCAALAHGDSLLIDTLTAQVRDLKRGPPLRFLAYGASDLGGRLFAGVEGTARVPLLPVTLYGRAEARVDSLAFGLRAGVAIPF